MAREATRSRMARSKYRNRAVIRQISFLVFAASMVMSLSVVSARAQAQDFVKDTFGDWEIRCLEASKETCVMSQVGKTAAGEVALEVQLQRLAGVTAENGQQVPAIVALKAPLGILIPYGVRIKIDGKDSGAIPLERCLASGCVSRTPIGDEAVSRMKKGSSSVFTFVLDKEIPVNVSLKGFTKAYNNLEPVRGQN